MAKLVYADVAKPIRIGDDGQTPSLVFRAKTVGTSEHDRLVCEGSTPSTILKYIRLPMGSMLRL